MLCVKCDYTREVEGKGDKAVVFAEDAKWLFPLHQCEEVICDGLTVEEVINAEQEVPVGKRVDTLTSNAL